MQSGSLITARFALQHNREVFAIPGSIHSPLSRGCHTLLREGATLIESVDDLREPLQGLLAFKREEIGDGQPSASSNPVSRENEIAADLTQEEASVLQAMNFDLINLDALSQLTGIETGTLLSTLMSLEIKGLIAQHNGAYQRLPKSA